ncbi:copper homeostasis protein CutC [Paenibacillus apiarius]|uniref:PF03932 family protein CutC n=1 Tax=Paenibacillus apiarius TaxID=46240 RepID=A0ABT4DNY3_9BACL|nr:copper homeostasis protein CutC [Paenibacillus apiarius]MCY9512786.1 copper homeostasis protein CutC [Paenibacillus apiarius]MCY9519070.1 copper homeostasis protein CutC [Paenibacillus apiarius]MCY9550879.1 copper homeostasis protein CutC [Paenibacillus apiarius]MCY9559687.1 copper homeostasis protein CutC [Paenibacillus apiarius]MCY9681930.1 copper homeostasis protein CutC [Paenibacillus apiarius]
MNSIVLEVIGTTLQEVKTAAQHGADRIELITAITEGGLTPSIGLVEEAVAAVDIPVNVMVRPHSRSFVYDADDMRTIVADVRRIRQTGANAIVFGVLTPGGKVDVPALEHVLAAADGMQMTFHRAIDEAKDIYAALDALLAYPQITTVLTSGGKPSALDARAEIAAMVRQAEGSKLAILAGSGLKQDAVSRFVRDTGVQQVHFGSNVRVNGQALSPIDPERLRNLKATIRSL